MAITERLALLVTLDAQGAVKGFNDLGKAADRNLGKADQRIDRFASRFQKAGAGMLAGAGLAAAGLYKAGQSAAELEQAMGGTEAVFADASGVIDDFAKKAATAAGLSESAFRTATTSIGGQLKGLGFGVEEAASQAVKLTQVAADLSATYGGTTAEAVAALGSAFRGEADPAEKFNLFLNQTRINAKAVEMGLAATTSSVDANAKAQATLALITEQSADAQGQFARESDTAAGAMAIFKAESENLMAALGGAVAPVLADVAGGLSGIVGGFNELTPTQQDAISKFVLLGTAALGTAGALSFTVGKVLDARDRFSQLAKAMRGTEGGMSKFGMAATGVTVGIGIFAAAMFKAQDRANKLRAAAAALREEAESTGETLEQVALKKLVDTFAESDDVSRNMDNLGLAFSDLRTPLHGSTEQFEAWRDSLFAADQAMNGTDRNASNLTSRVGVLRAELDAASTTTDRTSEAMADLGIAAPPAAGGIDEVTEATSRSKEALDAAKESVDLFKQGLDEAFTDLDLEQAVDRRAAAFGDLAERFADAQENVAAAKQRLADLNATPVEDRSTTHDRDVLAAQEDLQDALAETDRSLRGNSETALQNREDVRGLVDDIGAIIEKHREEGASLEELQTIRALEREGLIDQLEQLRFNTEEIGHYVEAIDAIPITKATTVTVETQAAEAAVQRLLDQLGRLDRLNELGLGTTADAAQAEKFVVRATAAVPAASRTTNIVINNPVPEPASDQLRRARAEAALVG